MILVLLGWAQSFHQKGVLKLKDIYLVILSLFFQDAKPSHQEENPVTFHKELHQEHIHQLFHYNRFKRFQEPCKVKFHKLLQIQRLTQHFL